VIALLLRGREPAGVLAGYLAFGLDPLLLPAVLAALLTIAATHGRRTAAVAPRRPSPRCPTSTGTRSASPGTSCPA